MVARAELDPAQSGVTTTVAAKTDSPAVKDLRTAGLQEKAQIFAGKLTKPDSEESDTDDD